MIHSGSFILGDLDRGPLHAAEMGAAFGLRESAVYDLASLTKVIVTSSLLWDAFLLQPADLSGFMAQPVRDFLPELRNTWMSDFTLGALWEHRAGLKANLVFFHPERSLFNGPRGRDFGWQQILSRILEESPGARAGETLYSDLGFLLLGLWLERRVGTDLDAQWRSWCAKHWMLPVPPPQFCRLDGSAPLVSRKVRPTERRHPVGEVNDDKAFGLHGVAPHAGLFGTVESVFAYLQTVQALRGREPRFEACVRARSQAGRFHAGWDRPQDPRLSHAGADWSSRVVGHLGFTGTAMWWDPATLRAGVLLTNRVCPAITESSKQEIRVVRRALFTHLWSDAYQQPPASLESHFHRRAQT